MNLLLIITGLVSYLSVFCDGMRNWKYEILSAYGNSTDENLGTVNLKIVPISLGVQAISGVIDWKYDTDENTMVTMIGYHSRNGREEDYSQLPYNVPTTSFNEFLEKYYMDMVYTDYGPCSNLPEFKEPFVPHWDKKVYVFDKCLPEGKNYPEIIPAGYYKLEVIISAKVDLRIFVIIKVTPKFV